jgi:hypothetical protein
MRAVCRHNTYAFYMEFVILDVCVFAAATGVLHACGFRFVNSFARTRLTSKQTDSKQ